MLNVQNGMIVGSRVHPKRYPHLEHGNMSVVNGIILHQTNSSFAVETLALYNFRDIGAHFLIDSNGRIYQTARIDQICFHVGKLKSLCMETHSCTAEDEKAINTIMAGPGSLEDRRTALHKREQSKAPQSRFPSNLDSIGIEVAGGSKFGVYDAPTADQNFAAKWLVGELLATLKLKRTAVFRHPQVSYKEPTEASQVQY